MHPFVDRRGRAPLLAVLALLAAVLLPAAPSRANGPAQSLLRALNATRAEHGVPPLRTDHRLARAARAHSADMVAHHYFAHESRRGERPCERVARTGWLHGRGHWWVGETLAWGIGRRGRPPAVVAAWLSSPPHRHVMLRSRYRVVGIGVVRGTPWSARGWTFTADFGDGSLAM
jgi:uncharacterized protein YkwD